MNCDFAFLDSGTGGIPYMIELKKKLPEAGCLYLGDTAHFPYGQKSVEEVTESASCAIEKIVREWNPRTLVIACNTISVTSLDFLRSRFPDLPIVGTVPAIKLAASVTENHRIGLLATKATVSNPYCRRLEMQYASDCSVFSRGDPDLIDFIEHRLFVSTMEEKKAAVRPACNFFKENGCDTVILGCTHFTHLASVIQDECGPDVKIVDSRSGVANQAVRVEQKTEEKKEGRNLPFKDMTFFVTRADSRESLEYETLCANLNIPWGGVL